MLMRQKAHHFDAKALVRIALEKDSRIERLSIIFARFVSLRVDCLVTTRGKRTKIVHYPMPSTRSTFGATSVIAGLV